ncbi:MAG: hypothetical protein K0S26_3325, partial [Bacteroidota bacterium]|nr:hypothetical protein [Bacteroidota bacterium]
FLLFSSCKKDKNRLPLITTSTFQSTNFKADVAGVLYNEGDSKVTEKGICWGPAANVTIDNNKIASTTEEKAFTVEISGLSPATTYYAKAYAISELGVSYGKEIKFTTSTNDFPVLSLSLLSVSSTSVSLKLNINQQSKATYTSGICWSTNFFPTVNSNSVLVKESNFNDNVPFINDFVNNFLDLNENSTYFFRAFSQNGNNIEYSSQVTVTTPNPIALTALNSLAISEATVSSAITNIDPSLITAVGVCWSQNQAPTTSDAKTEEAYTGNNFTLGLNSLLPNTKYFVRSYIKTASKTIYSSQESFKTYYGTVTDIDGNVYYTVLLGNQEWMASNLRTSRYNDGTVLQYAPTYGTLISNGVSQIPQYTYSNYNSSVNIPYGKLYPGYVAFSTKIAPVGWHLPTVTEWQTVLSNNSIYNLWDNGTSFSGNGTRLSILPGGQENGAWFGQYGRFYCKQITGSSSNQVGISLQDYSFQYTVYPDHTALSIRCVKD